VSEPQLKLEDADPYSSTKNDSFFDINLKLDHLYNYNERHVFTLQNWAIAVAGISRGIMIVGLFAT
jgi:hypothetical protein